MLVRYWMSKPVITVDADARTETAEGLMRRHEIGYLPVIDDRRLVGVLTRRDLRGFAPVDGSGPTPNRPGHDPAKTLVREIMSPHPITVGDDWTMEEAAEIMLVSKISGLPVTEKNGKLAGVVTRSDIFRLIISLTGVGKRGIQFAFRTLDRPGCIRELTDAIRAYGGRLSSILSSYERVPKGYRRLFIRAYGIDRPSLGRLKEILAQKATLLYTVDHREKQREIYE